MLLREFCKLKYEPKIEHHNTVNIICFMPTINMLQSFLSKENVFISVLFVARDIIDNIEYQKVIKDNSSKIAHIVFDPVSYEEFFEIFKSDYQVSLDEIEAFKSVQLDCTREMARSVLPLTEIDYRYLVALGFWKYIFKTYSIDFIFSATRYHGNLFDSFVYFLAEKNDIPIYSFELQLTAKGFKVFALQKRIRGNRIFVSLSNLIEGINFDFEKYCYDRINQNIDKETSKVYIRRFKWKILQRRVIYFLNKIRLSQLQLFDLQAKKFYSFFTFGILDIAKCLSYVKEIKKIYNKLSFSCDFNDKYIFFPLHFEPEAKILNNVSCSNQLFLIKMLADNLPPGWKVYVKEHPNQFATEKQRLWYYFYSIKFFRPKSFYWHLSRMKNVKLINHSVPSENIIKNASAVASLFGTACFESLYNKKPLLYMGQAISIMNVLSCVFKINSGKDVYNALKCIDNGHIVESSSLLDELNFYLIELEDEKNNHINELEQAKFDKILNWIINDDLLKR